MAHNLNEERMFYVGATPWHGLGTKLDNPATAAEAITAANLDYKIQLKTIYIEPHKQTQVFKPILNKKATVRIDTNEPLGIVSDKYKLVQNVEAFNFFDVVVGEGQAIYHTAGALGKGERIWIMAKLPKDIILSREDVVEKYLLLTNSHDGTSALKMYFTPVRVVCQNTLNMSLADSGSGISIRHIGNIHDKVEEARKVLGVAVNYYDQFENICQQLVDLKLDGKQVNSYFDKLVFLKEDDKNSTIFLRKKNDLLVLFERGKGNDTPEVKHSAWAAYNSVTEYVDHYKTVRNEKNNPTNRLKDMWFGNGARLKEEAYLNILEVAGIKI
jgi:phage/plasmid-like protein (TIGR03299 family)